jgi:hypothetical protein
MQQVDLAASQHLLKTLLKSLKLRTLSTDSLYIYTKVPVHMSESFIVTSTDN